MIGAVIVLKWRRRQTQD